MPGSTLAAIGEAMLLDESTLARNFAVMERRGLVMAEGGRGRGGKQVLLTRSGKKLAQEASAIWQRTNRHLGAEFDAKTLEAGRAFLRELGQASERLRLKDETAASAATRRRASVD
jgi:DNA-binding MarR family transcriptional regulator